MKKVILAALNAKYIHSNLALRYLSRFEENHKKYPISVKEFTINQRTDFIIEELYRQQPDVILFSLLYLECGTASSACSCAEKSIARLYHRLRRTGSQL